MGEGISLQLARGGRRVLWLAHGERAEELQRGRRHRSAQAEADRADRSAPRQHAVELAGSLRRPEAVAYQVSEWGLSPRASRCSTSPIPSGRARSPSSTPPGRIRAAATSFWFVDGKTVHMACSDPELKPRDMKDDQIYRIVDVSNPRARSPSAAGTCPAPWKATTRRRLGACRPGSTRAFAHTTPTSIPSGPTAAISATSTAA